MYLDWMGCFSCFDSKEEVGLNQESGRDDVKKEEQPMVAPRVNRVSSDLPPEKEPLDWNTRMKIAAGAAKGLRVSGNGDSQKERTKNGSKKEDSPKEKGRNLDRERAVAEAKMWGESLRRANAQGNADVANG
ncbi:Serine/threonine-protein kinase PBS1 [Acorus gramineus]|uniref:Serine/threonine-protein kinase PBS1 n=1 Tax=Acorus gramineus TaxID=55184 RepID=A0AAV9B1T0_ACOGR|nr:Serine/threonine-protein kinase PBS1 [Acorus gramineus]